MLTVNEAKDKLGISRAAVYYAMSAGKLKYVEKYGKRLLDERSVAGYSPRTYRCQRTQATASQSEMQGSPVGK